MARMPGVPFVTPKSYSTGRPGGPGRYITLHYTAGHEGPNDAENGAAYDQRRTDGTSTHFFVDSNSIVQCVDTANRSHTALYHGNLWGFHVEICGTRQTRAQWLDEVSRATIRKTAEVCLWLMHTHGIPLTRLATSAVRSPSAKGFVDHNDWTVGWPEDGGSHTDVGPEFPWDVLFADIRDLEDGMTPEEVWQHQWDSPSLGVPMQSAIQWVKDLVVQGRANAEDIAVLGDQVAALLASLQSLHVKVDALALGQGDPAATATAVANLLSVRLSE